MTSTKNQFNYNFNHGQQIALLQDIVDGHVVTAEMIARFFNAKYQSSHPKTVAQFRNLFQALRDYQTLDGQQIASMSDVQKNTKLADKIAKGREMAALALLGNGARLDKTSIDKLQDSTFKAKNPLTVKALTAFLPYWKPSVNPQAQRASIPNPPSNPAVPMQPPLPANRELASSQDLEDNLINLRNLNIGDGGFVNQEPFTHADIERIKLQYENNPTLKAAFNLVKGLDIANRNDILTLSHYIHDNPSNLTATNVTNAIDEERTQLKKIWNNEDNAMSLPCDDSFKQMLKNNGVLDYAKKILREHPTIVKGELPECLAKFRNKELAGLKAALAMTARLKGANQGLFDKLHGFYKATVPHGAAYQGKLLFANALYVPASGYILGADQLSSNEREFSSQDANYKAGITDCSGFMTDILRESRPDLTWLKDHRLQSWGLEPAHDYKYINRSDVANQEGPIQYNGKRRAHLSQTERHKLATWKQNNPNQFDTINKAFDTVKNRDDVKAGDFIVYRQRRNGRDYSSDTGHVALVVDHHPGTNQAILLEYTRSGGRDGVGFTKRPICYGSESNTVWESRVLRPKPKP